MASPPHDHPLQARPSHHAHLAQPPHPHPQPAPPAHPLADPADPAAVPLATLIRETKTRNPEMKIKHVHESGLSQYRFIKKRKQHDLFYRIADAQRSGDLAKIKSVKKRVDNHASAVASRDRQEFLISSFERLVRNEMSTASRLADALLQYAAHCERLEQQVRALSRPDSLAVRAAAMAVAAAAAATNPSVPPPAAPKAPSAPASAPASVSASASASAPASAPAPVPAPVHDRQQLTSAALHGAGVVEPQSAVSQSTEAHGSNLSLHELHAPELSDVTGLGTGAGETTGWISGAIGGTIGATIGATIGGTIGGAIGGTETFGLESQTANEENVETWDAGNMASVMERMMEANSAGYTVYDGKKLDEDEGHRFSMQMPMAQVQESVRDERRRSEEDESINPMA